MKFGILGAMMVALPLTAAMAQSPVQKQADMAEALRVQQLICSGIADVRARGGDYSDHDLAQCIMRLADQRAEYARFMTAGVNTDAGAAAPRRVTSRAQVATTQFAAQ